MQTSFYPYDSTTTDYTADAALHDCGREFDPSLVSFAFLLHRHGVAWESHDAGDALTVVNQYPYQAAYIVSPNGIFLFTS